MHPHLFVAILFAFCLASSQAQLDLTWCGKHYMKGASVVPPGGEFQVPAASSNPLLNFQCWPAIKPYLSGESASLIIDTRITSLKVPGATPLKNTKNENTLNVSVSVNGGRHVLGSVKLNTTGTEFSLPLNSLQPRKQPYTVTCTGVFPVSNQTFTTSTQIHYLPLPSRGSVTKQDFRTGSLLVASQGGIEWEPVFPIGFYTSFDGFLSNVSNVDDIKARGMNIVHPVPSFDNQTAFVQALDRMEELGLWLMYDMRLTYQNHTSVTEQVNFIKNRTNLLLWYTADEPDGTSDPLNATKVTYDLINDLDGYHPVSLVLNCQDYFFSEYASGADVLLQDAYPLNINATFSRVWHTPCTRDFGDCGCDNCNGTFEDVSARVDEFKLNLDLLGRSRSTSVWTVPQAFGNESYWPIYPTGAEWLVESILGINHGALGVVPWDDPTSTDIRSSSSVFAAAVPHIVPFLSTSGATFSSFRQNRVDVALWTLGNKTLLLAANPNRSNSSAVIAGLNSGTATQILNGGSDLAVQDGQLVLTLQGTGTGGWVFQR